MNVVYTIGAPDSGYAPGAACVLSIVASRVEDAVDASQILFPVVDFEFTITDNVDDTTTDNADDTTVLESVQVTQANGSTTTDTNALNVALDSRIVLTFDKAKCQCLRIGSR